MIGTKRNNMKVLRFNSRVNKTFARDLIRISSRSFIFVGNPERLVATEKIVFSIVISKVTTSKINLLSPAFLIHMYTLADLIVEIGRFLYMILFSIFTIR